MNLCDSYAIPDRWSGSINCRQFMLGNIEFRDGKLRMISEDLFYHGERP